MSASADAPALTLPSSRVASPPMTGAPGHAWTQGFGTHDAAAVTHIAAQDQASPQSLFDTSEWLTAAAATAPLGREVWTLTHRSTDGALGCVLPFTFGRETIYRVPLRTARALGDPLSDRLNPARTQPVRWSHLLEGLAEGPQTWDVAVLSEVTLSADEREDVRRWAALRGWGVEFRLCGRAPLLDLGPAHEKGLAKTYSRKMRKTLTQSRNRLMKLGDLQVEVRQLTAQTLDAAFSTALRIDQRSWKGAAGSSLFADAGRISQVRQATLSLIDRSPAIFREMRLDGQPISYGFGWLHGGAYLDYQMSFDAEFAHHSPGKLLMHEGLEGLIGMGVRRYDASRGSLLQPSLMLNWTDVVREHHRLYVYRATPAGRALQVLGTGVRPLVRRMRGRATDAA